MFTQIISNSVENVKCHITFSFSFQQRIKCGRKRVPHHRTYNVTVHVVSCFVIVKHESQAGY